MPTFISTKVIQRYALALFDSASLFVDSTSFLSIIQSAVLCLTDMRVQPDFVPKIMHTLSLSAAPSAVLRFVRLAKPLLTDQASLEVYVGALCSVNIVEALLYARNFPESADEAAQRPRLTGMILNSCLMRKFALVK